MRVVDELVDRPVLEPERAERPRAGAEHRVGFEVLPGDTPVVRPVLAEERERLAPFGADCDRSADPDGEQREQHGARADHTADVEAGRDADGQRDPRPTTRGEVERRQEHEERSQDSQPGSGRACRDGEADREHDPEHEEDADRVRGSAEGDTPTRTVSSPTAYRSVRSDSITDPVGRLDHSEDAAVQAVSAPKAATATHSRPRNVIRSRATSAAAKRSRSASSVNRQVLGKNPPPERPTTRTTPKVTIAGRASIQPIRRLLRTATAPPSNRGLHAAARARLGESAACVLERRRDAARAGRTRSEAG